MVKKMKKNVFFLECRCIFFVKLTFFCFVCFSQFVSGWGGPVRLETAPTGVEKQHTWGVDF